MSTSCSDRLTLAALLALAAVSAQAQQVEQGAAGRRGSGAWELSPRPPAGWKGYLTIEETTTAGARHGALREKKTEQIREFELLLEIDRRAPSGVEEPQGEPTLECLARVERVALRDDHPLHPVRFTQVAGDESPGRGPGDAPAGTDSRIERLRELTGARATIPLGGAQPAPEPAIESRVIELAGVCWSDLPGRPVKVGETWEARRTADVPGVGSVEIVRTYELERIVMRGVRRLARISITLSGGAQDSSESACDLEQLSGKGEREIDLDTGMLASEQMECRISLTSETTKLTTRTETTIQVRTVR